MNINDFMSLKINKECQILDNNIIDRINKLFEDVDYNKLQNRKSFYKNPYNVRKPNSILKNVKLQSKKDTITNKVNLILNKLSEGNIDALVLEFIENINRIEPEDYNEILKTFYLKIISEISFVKIYLLFLKYISYLYENIQNYNISYFVLLIETKFKLDYTSNFSIDCNDDKFFLTELSSETQRNNNLSLLYNMCNLNLLDNKLLVECDNIIINQSKYLPDIYFWINIRNLKITDEIKTIINKHLSNKLIQSRDSILLNNIIDNKNNVINKQTKEVVNKTIIKTDTNILEMEYILEEYLLVKSVDDIKYFIENKCKDAIIKNKFCEILFSKYFTSSAEQVVELIELIKQLIKQQILYKSNLSRGLLLIHNSWNKNKSKYTKSIDRMKNILNVLKNIGITKGLEELIDNYK
jgi:hypothetical protein